jgi:hypothetical protein
MAKRAVPFFYSRKKSLFSILFFSKVVFSKKKGKKIILEKTPHKSNEQELQELINQKSVKELP